VSISARTHPGRRPTDANEFVNWELVELDEVDPLWGSLSTLSLQNVTLFQCQSESSLVHVS
jgi:hypothetical protein